MTIVLANKKERVVVLKVIALLHYFEAPLVIWPTVTNCSKSKLMSKLGSHFFRSTLLTTSALAEII